jgi:hypothetical protein
MQLGAQLSDLQNEQSTLRQQEKDLQTQLSGERLSATYSRNRDLALDRAQYSRTMNHLAFPLFV